MDSRLRGNDAGDELEPSEEEPGPGEVSWLANPCAESCWRLTKLLTAFLTLAVARRLLKGLPEMIMGVKASSIRA